MQKSVWRYTIAAAVSYAALCSPVHASVVINFEGIALAGAYAPGQSFSQSGFTMTSFDDFGNVGTTDDLGDAAPTGNNTQFFFNRNDGFLTLKATDGGLFSLDGFSAAFVPRSPLLMPSPEIVIVAAGYQANGNAFGTYFGLGSTGPSGFPFFTYGNPADFGRFNNLVEVQFFACVQDDNVCVTATNGNGQFALDDIRVTAAVPEPASWALALAALSGLAFTGRRRPLTS
jgi:PEP-CTERM motif